MIAVTEFNFLDIDEDESANHEYDDGQEYAHKKTSDEVWKILLAVCSQSDLMRYFRFTRNVSEQQLLK